MSFLRYVHSGQEWTRAFTVFVTLHSISVEGDPFLLSQPSLQPYKSPTPFFFSNVGFICSHGGNVHAISRVISDSFRTCILSDISTITRNLLH